MIPQEQPGCSANSHLTDVKWGPLQGTNPLQRLLCQGYGDRWRLQSQWPGDMPTPQMNTEPVLQKTLTAMPPRALLL